MLFSALSRGKTVYVSAKTLISFNFTILYVAILQFLRFVSQFYLVELDKNITLWMKTHVLEARNPAGRLLEVLKRLKTQMSQLPVKNVGSFFSLLTISIYSSF